MSLDTYNQAYKDASTKASDIARQLAFTGIALIWIFKNQNGQGSLSLPSQLVWPSFLLILTLGFDLLQYVWKAIAFGWFHRYHEKRIKSFGKDKSEKERKELEAPRYINWPTLFFFWAKLITVTVAYCLILKFLFSALGIPIWLCPWCM